MPIDLSEPQDWAFVPGPLPPSWSIPDRLWRLIAEARQKVGDLNGSGNRLTNARLLLRPLQRREALRSSSLEGTYATPKELLLFEKSRKEIEGNETSQENQWREVHNYYAALKHGQQHIMHGKPFDLDFFCTLHGILMKGVRGHEKNPGQVRTSQVHIRGERRFTPAPPSEILSCIDNLEAYLAADHGDVDPLVRAFISHYQFEAIHPFSDGNGRIGRVLLSLVISRWLGLSKPWLYLSEYFDNHRSDYMNRLFRVSTHGDWDEWIELCILGTIEQAESSIARCNALELLRLRYHERVSKGSARLHTIVDMLFSSSPLISIGEAQKALGTSYPTARDDLLRLQDVGIVELIDGVYPKMFGSEELLKIAYID